MFPTGSAEHESLWFRGECYLQRGIFKGSWGNTREEKVSEFSMEYSMIFDIDVELKMKDGDTVTEQLTFNAVKYEFGGSKIELKGLDQDDSCSLIHLIHAPDVKFVQHDKELYVQAKMISKPDADTGRNGDGYIDTSLKLYHISSIEK